MLKFYNRFTVNPSPLQILVQDKFQEMISVCGIRDKPLK